MKIFSFNTKHIYIHLDVPMVSFHLAGNSILHSAADSVTSAVQKASQALNERGERLGRAEEKTEELKNSAQQFAETAHKVRVWWDKSDSRSEPHMPVLPGKGALKRIVVSRCFQTARCFSLMFLLTWQRSGLPLLLCS